MSRRHIRRSRPQKNTPRKNTEYEATEKHGRTRIGVDGVQTKGGVLAPPLVRTEKIRVYPCSSVVIFSVFFRGSEDNLCPELNLSRQVVLARHLPEVRVRRISVRVVVHHAIQRIQDLDVELQPNAPLQRYLLDDRHIPQVEERTPQTVDTGREVADVACQTDAGIGPLLQRIVPAVFLPPGVGEKKAA